MRQRIGVPGGFDVRQQADEGGRRRRPRRPAARRRFRRRDGPRRSARRPVRRCHFRRGHPRRCQCRPGRPGRPGRASGTGRAARRRAGGDRRRSRGPRPWPELGEECLQQRLAVDRPAGRVGQARPAGVGWAGPIDVAADADDDGHRSWRSAGRRCVGLGEHAGQLVVADEQVVRPLHGRPDAGHRPAGRGGGEGDRGGAEVEVVGERTGRSRTETSRLLPGGASHRRPSRPRPAVWWSATATRPAGAPRRASPRR